VIYQQPNPGIKYEYMLPMKIGDLTPAMMSVPSVADNGIIAPPLLVPPGTETRKENLNTGILKASVVLHLAKKINIYNFLNHIV
jgi:hypothetical protein